MVQLDSSIFMLPVGNGLTALQYVAQPYSMLRKYL